MQEIKAQVTDMTTEMLNPEGYYGYFHYAEKKGYSGVGIYTKNSRMLSSRGWGIPL
jgi:exodeoxyribonuclease-3